MEPPKICCICCTYLRPAQLGEVIESFLQQDYPSERRELVIVDDAGQYKNQHGSGWRLVSLDQRFITLGEKRNCVAGLASPDVEAYAVWDDDDVYLPWHLSTMAEALRSSSWTIPRYVWLDKKDGLKAKETKGLFHGSWGFHREAFATCNGYPFMQSGQDQGLARRFRRQLQLKPADPCEFGPPSYIYRWFSNGAAWHLSAMGQGGYERLAQRNEDAPRIEHLEIGWSKDWVSLATCASAEKAR